MNMREKEWKDEYAGAGIKDEYETEGMKRWIWGRRNNKISMREKE